MLPRCGNILRMTNRDSIAGTVGGNIRELRLERAQTLAGLAERSGISVRTLVEIEGGRANASLATLGAIADALGVDFGRLIRPPESGATRLVAIADAHLVWSDEQGSEARLVLVSRQPQSVELWAWSLRPGGRYQAEPDPAGTDVLIVVTRGALTLTGAGEATKLTAGTAGQISPVGGYVLANQARSATEFTLVHIPPAGAHARYTRPDARFP
jgi:transcriptional regulator with XRE-family HTH domain